MGYHIRTGLVDESVATLDMIYDAAQQNKAIAFKCRSPEDMSSMKYQFNKLLKAATILTNEAGGRFVGLRERVEVREDWSNMAIVIAPKKGAHQLTNLTPMQPDENDFIKALSTASGSIFSFHFQPSPHFNFTLVEAKANQRGWTCINKDGEPMIAESPSEPELTMITALPMKEKKSAFSILEQMKPNP